MFNKILVALDGTPEAATVLPLAEKLARVSSAALILARVTTNYHVDAPVNIAAREELTRVAARPDLAAVPIRTTVLYGEAAEQIIEEARISQADLIMMATHGRGGLARTWLGSVTEGVLAHSPVPVLVLREGVVPPQTLRTLLVPFDGTPGSVAALAVARELAKATGAEIALVQVIPALPRWGDGWDVEPAWEEEARSMAQQTLDWLAQSLAKHGIAAIGYAHIGNVASTIVAATRDAGADLVIMSTKALTGPKRVLLGSVADAVMRTVGVPILLVRQTEVTPTGVAVFDDGDEARPDRIIPVA